jgi:predicted dehydrogenase
VKKNFKRPDIFYGSDEGILKKRIELCRGCLKWRRSEMLKIGLLGCGGIMGAHLPGWKAVQSKAKVSAACDIIEDRAKRRSDELEQNTVIYTDWKKMLAESDIDAVDIALPHYLHAPAIIDAAEAGKHVMTEKPLCISLEEARNIEAAIKANGVLIQCAHNQMFEPAPRLARKWVKEGKVGRVYSIRTVDCFRSGGDTGVKDWGWRGKLETCGGGCAIDTGYHPAYMLISLANSEPKEVVSFTDNFHQKNLEGDDSAQTMVRFENGAIGTLQTSWAHNVPNGHWQIAVIGSKGQIYGRGKDLYFAPNEGEVEKAELEPANGFVEEIKHFVECMETGKTPEQSLYEGVTVLKVILGGYQSEKTGIITKL